MKRKTILILSALIVGVFISAIAIVKIKAGAGIYNTHSIWTEDDPVSVRDGNTGCSYTSIEKWRSITSWSEEGPPLYPAIAHFRGVVVGASGSFFCGTHDYDFRLIDTTQTDKENIVGTWDIYRDGSLVCSACDGRASDLGAAVSTTYKVDIDDPINGTGAWQFYADVTQRYGF